MLYSEFIELSGINVDMEVYAIIEQHYTNDTTTKTKKEWFDKYGLSVINKAYMTVLQKKNDENRQLILANHHLTRMAESDNTLILQILRTYVESIYRCQDLVQKLYVSDGPKSAMYLAEQINEKFIEIKFLNDCIVPAQYRNMLESSLSSIADNLEKTIDNRMKSLNELIAV